MLKGNTPLTVPDESAVLQISYLGFDPQEVMPEGNSILDVSMVESDLALDEVVVTAFGLERDKKALGYSVQEVAAGDLTQARSTNVVNGLSGRVAGIQITGSGVPGGGSQVIIRGNSSILGNNQPLYVIDGVPMEGDFAGPTGTGNNVYGGGIFRT